MKKLVSIIAVIMLIFSLSACADTNVKGSVVRKDANGSAVLDIMPEKLMEQVEIGKTALVTIGDFSAEMPLVRERIAEEGKLQLVLDEEAGSISVCIYNQRFCEVYQIAAGEKVTIKKP